MNKKLLSYFLIIMTIVGVNNVLASRPPFMAGYEIEHVSEIEAGHSWQVGGKIYDNSNLGYTGLDAETNNFIVCDTSIGDIDVYLLTNILYRSSSYLTCEVVYAQSGTPTMGQPTYTRASISYSLDNIAAIEPTLQGSGISPELQTGIRNASLMGITTQMVKQLVYPASDDMVLYSSTNNYGIWKPLPGLTVGILTLTNDFQNIPLTNSLIKLLADSSIVSNGLIPFASNSEGTTITLCSIDTNNLVSLYKNDNLRLLTDKFTMGLYDIMILKVIQNTWTELDRKDF